MGSILMSYMADLLLYAKSRDQKILIIQSYQMKKNLLSFTLYIYIYILNNINMQQKQIIVIIHSQVIMDISS